MKLILTGDLHLGRTSTRVPDPLRDQARTLQAWNRLVEAVVEAKADALLLSGDLIDASNRFWETSGPFEQGVRTLHAHHIQTLAICGNHDAAVLPGMARTLKSDGFTLLGADGTWERKTLSQNGTPQLHVDGWSFPAETVFQDPLESYSPPVSDGLPVLGMVHGDPGVPDSRYAPLSRQRLNSAPVSGWLLGHIHKPGLKPGSPWVLMPGSPHPLDPGEPGAHHAWSCEVKNGQLLSPEPFEPAGLRYEDITIHLTRETVPSADRIRNEIQKAVDALKPKGHTVLRVQVEGTTRQPDLLKEAVAHMTDGAGTGAWSIDRVDVNVHPDLDLNLVRQAGPVPESLVQALQEGHPGLSSRIEDLLDHLNAQSHFTDKSLPRLQETDLPLTSVLEEALRHALPEPPPAS